MELETWGTRSWPLRVVYPYPPHPFSPLNWSSGWQRDKPSALCTIGDYHTHNPSAHLPLPSCGGQCPNANMSHLGLAKPVPVVGGAGVTCSVESTHPWRKHSGSRTGWLTGLGTDNSVNHAQWQTASQNNKKTNRAETGQSRDSPTTTMLTHIFTSHIHYMCIHSHTWTHTLTWQISFIACRSELLVSVWQRRPKWESHIFVFFFQCLELSGLFFLIIKLVE